jgi:hypothetical protein
MVLTNHRGHGRQHASSGSLTLHPHKEILMSNPWSKKNPYLSAWLSGANAIAGSARGHAANGMQRQVAAATRQMTEVVMSAWLAPLAVKTPKGRKRR